MKTNQTKIDFSDGFEVFESFLQFEKIIFDRGSKYSVSGGRVENRDDVKNFLQKLKSDKNYASATHHSWAVRISYRGTVFESKNDDGETGAGAVILRVLQRENFQNGIVVVTRWFGGIKLMNDRFLHVQNATKYFLAQVRGKKG